MKIQEFPLWKKLEGQRTPLSFDLELTARCNNDCRHCYINVPAGDAAVAARELSVDDILDIARQATDMGALWCLLTGGEPLLRADFAEIYMGLKRLGLLISLFTNACLVTPAHVALLRKYPPRDIEVTMYGHTPETHDRVTRRHGSHEAFARGLALLEEAGLGVRLKAMVLRSNVHEVAEMSCFGRAHTKDHFRLDPLLHLRFDGDPVRNEEIVAERLSPAEIAAVEQADAARSRALLRSTTETGPAGLDGAPAGCAHLFHCGAGVGSFAVGFDGMFRLCSSLCHPGTVYDLRNGSLREAWEDFVPRVREMQANDAEFLGKCGTCALINLCMWCPAHTALETGTLDRSVEYYCDVAHARAEAVQAAGTC